MTSEFADRCIAVTCEEDREGIRDKQATCGTKEGHKPILGKAHIMRHGTIAWCQRCGACHQTVNR